MEGEVIPRCQTCPGTIAHELDAAASRPPRFTEKDVERPMTPCHGPQEQTFGTSHVVLCPCNMGDAPAMLFEQWAAVVLDNSDVT